MPPTLRRPRRPAPEWPSADDMVIAIMGMTGSGKSSFIDQFRPQRRPHIGHGLDAGTVQVDMYRCYDNELGYFWLIDTPGFDDQTASDAQILERIAAWMRAAYLEHILLAGIIYLHSIAVPRFAGSSRRNVDLFHRLCGRNALRKVLLVTSFWDDVPTQLSERRAEHNERELKMTTDFWGRLIRGGAKTERHDNTLQSAREVIQTISDMRTDEDPGVYTDLQTEMDDPQRPLNETSVGREIQRLLDEARRIFEEERRQRRRQHQATLATEGRNHDRELARLEAAHRAREGQLQRDQEILSSEAATLEERCLELRQQAADEARRQRRVQATLAEEDQAIREAGERRAEIARRIERREDLRNARKGVSLSAGRYGVIPPRNGMGGAWVRKKKH